MNIATLKRLEDVVCEKLAKAKFSLSVDAQCFAERVEKKAYELYQRRGYRLGHDWQDWFDAEKLVEDEMIAGG